MITIDTKFESGSIGVVRAERADDIVLELLVDTNSDLHQWFSFAITTADCTKRTVTIQSVDKTGWAGGWPVYQMYASYDRAKWFCVPTKMVGNDLVVEHTPQHSQVYYAYTTPYSFERHCDQIAKWQQLPQCQVSVVGHSVQGRPMHLLTIGTPSEDKKKCWVIGRQHSGEAMAEWCVEGLVDSLLDPNNTASQELLAQSVFYIVPNMNPDGTVLGHQRMNALGVDLNREWKQPRLDKSPEVYSVRQAMHDVGVDFMLDAHGDEELPYVFFAYRPSTDRIEALRDTFQKRLLEVNENFQTEHGYPAGSKDVVNLSVAINYVSHTFDCPTFTLEMPFSDNHQNPQPAVGWSSARSQQFGGDLLVALNAIVGDLR